MLFQPKTTSSKHALLLTGIRFQYVLNEHSFISYTVAGVYYCSIIVNGKSFDLRDVNFSCAAVGPLDVIHASKKDIDSIFKISGTAIEQTRHKKQPTLFSEMLVKADHPQDRKKTGIDLHNITLAHTTITESIFFYMCT